MSKVILISKDILMCRYLVPYGNKEYEMPNICDLAAKGTIFRRHYTAAPSTAMAFTSMFTGKYPYETNRKKYVEVDEYEGDTLFDRLHRDGYECHILWDKRYVYLAQRFSKCYGQHSVFHNVDWLTQDIPPHISGEYDDLTYRDEYTAKALAEMRLFLEENIADKKDVFLWIHFPHVIAGRNTYGSDMDVFDKMVGYCRAFFDDVFITADHGHMNGIHGKYGYGFDVYEPAIHIPLITPRIQGVDEIDFPTSNTQLLEIILDRCVHKEPYVFSETAYYQQPHRKLAIIQDNFKYIYEKETGRHAIYDLSWDPGENVNLAYPEIYDSDRHRYFSISQRIYYRNWGIILKKLNELKSVKIGLWRDVGWGRSRYERVKAFVKLWGVRILNK